MAMCIEIIVSYLHLNAGSFLLLVAIEQVPNKLIEGIKANIIVKTTKVTIKKWINSLSLQLRVVIYINIYSFFFWNFLVQTQSLKKKENNKLQQC